MNDAMDQGAALRRKVEERQARVGVIGLGYVGLPLALAFCEKGFAVSGLDVDPRKVEQLRAGHCYLSHIADARVSAVVEDGRFEASNDFAALSACDVVIVCVPTPLSVQREPDLSYVESTGEEIRKRLRPGQLVVLESTTYPGTTDGLLREVLERDGLRVGADFFLAFSPEREDPGNVEFTTTTIPKVVGGVDVVSGDLAELVYSQVIAQVVRVSSAAAAEATKLTENIFRAVNIALVNELKVTYDRMGIDVWEVLEAADTKPFGFMRFNPGPGWGGHCIPLDPFYLSWKAREFGLDTRFIELAGQVNRRMPTYVVERLQAGLNERGKALRGSRVLVLGLAYKKDVGDTRESPSFEIIKQVLRLGADVSYHDPHVPSFPETRSWPGHPRMDSVTLDAETLRQQDAVVLVTDHSGVDYALVEQHADLIVDSRGVYRGQRPRVVKA